MHMVFSERVNSDASEPTHGPIRLERVESTGGDATVRHVDQLGTETLADFYDAIEGGTSMSHTLEEGEIIVFGDYYRVERI